MANNLNKELRERLSERDTLLVPGAPNALAAKITEDIGFEAVYVTGAGIANTYLGVPDIGLVTLTELAEQVAAIRDAVVLPLIVDADTGFGNPLNVMRTVKMLERSGANAIQIEDQITPKRCGHFNDKRVIGRDEMVQKVRAAADARQDDDLIIVARTDARAALGFEEAVERAAAYLEAGADVTFIEAPQSEDEVAAIPQRLPGPQVINMVQGGRTPLLGLEELESYAIALYANAALQGAIYGMQNVLGHLHEHGSMVGVLDEIAGWDERQRIVGHYVFEKLDEKYAAQSDRR